MATKKTAKKSTASAPAETTQPAPPAAKAPVKAATKKVAAKKSAPPPAAKKAATKPAAKKSVAKAPEKPSPDVIARAAYLNYRRRVEQGLPGDARGDWLEAERYFSASHES